MVLTAASLAHYMLARGLVDASSLVDGDFEVYDISRRNLVFRVPRSGYVVKQVKQWKERPIATFEIEASFYSLLRDDERLAPLRRFPPKCYLYDSENQVLAFELVETTERQAPDLSVAFARQVGESLRQWHKQAGKFRDLESFRECDPWPLSFHLQPDDHFDHVSPANAELLRVVRRDVAFGHALDALREQWSATTLVHGDMRWDNCVGGRPAALRFIDWEMAGWGDPLWDAAGILQEYLSLWVLNGLPNRKIAPAMRAFWKAYGASRKSLARAIGYAASRMIQTAFEHQDQEDAMIAPSVRLLQTALNMLESPKRAIALFFGRA